MAPPKRAGVFRYVKEAFLFRWNLLGRRQGNTPQEPGAPGEPEVVVAPEAPEEEPEPVAIRGKPRRIRRKRADVS